MLVVGSKADERKELARFLQRNDPFQSGWWQGG
jgi:hypothetical protein